MSNHIIETSLKKFYSNRFISRTSSATAALISLLQVLKEKNKNKNEVIIPSMVVINFICSKFFISTVL